MLLLHLLGAMAVAGASSGEHLIPSPGESPGYCNGAILAVETETDLCQSA